MNLNLIPFGLIEESNEFVDVYDVQRGAKCNCICPSCKTPLIARQKDRAWHFAHSSKKVYEKTRNECDYSFFLSVRMMARQLIGSKVTLGLPKYSGFVQDSIGESYEHEYITEDFVVTQEKNIAIDNIKVETSFSGAYVDIIGSISDFKFVIYFTHPNRTTPSELFNPEHHKCGVISVSLDLLPEFFSQARKNDNSYKDALIEFLLSDRKSKTWIYHPNFQKTEAIAKQKLDVRKQENEALKALKIERERQSRIRMEEESQTEKDFLDVLNAISDENQNLVKQVVKYKCLSCKNTWECLDEAGSNCCPKCNEHLYSRKI